MSDWGGPIGLRVAVEQRTKVSALIIGNTFAWPVNGDFHFEAFSRFFGGFLGRFLIRRFHAFVRLLIPAGTKKAKLSSEEMQAYLLPMNNASKRMPTYIFSRAILKSRDYLQKLEGDLESLHEKESLILWGDRDIAFRTLERQKFEKYFTNHKTRVLSGAGHFIWEDSPQEIADAILEFLSKKK